MAGTDGNDLLIGTQADDLLEGGLGNDELIGLGGNDTMDGGLGDDTFRVEDSGDIVIERAGEGYDIVRTTIDYWLRSHVEVLLAHDAAGTLPLRLTGNELNNVIYGNAGANGITGGAGADVMAGFGGNDGYAVDDVADEVIELADEGYDRVFSSVNYTLSANVEELLALDFASTSPLLLTGNALNNVIWGNAGDNGITGGAGADQMIGLGGNDGYAVDNAGDVVVESAGGGYDRIFASVNYTLSANAEELLALDFASTASLLLTGNELNNVIWGNAGDNGITGGAGVDQMIGGSGNDGYAVDNAGDTVYEYAGGGYDRVFASINYTLAGNVEELLALDFASTSPLLLTGNELNNVIYGNAGDNGITGGAGADQMIGFGGNDGYAVDNVGDVVVETAGGGYDRVFASVNHALAANVEELLALDLGGTSPLLLTGNALNNVIYGNAGDNGLTGGAGADQMIGFGGNDGYAVDNIGDTIVESAGGGYDRIFAGVNYTLSANVEELVALDLASTAPLMLTGNELNNVILGNAGNNLLNGGRGSDTIFGYGGSDTFAFTEALAGGNVDSIQDFNVAQDRILLGGQAGQAFAALNSGTLLSSAFVIGTQPVGTRPVIIYNSATGALSYDADGTGSAAATTQFATLSTGLNLTAGHFQVDGPPNSAPTVTSPATASVQENSATSTIVYQAIASDAEGDAFSFSISGQDAARLSIDGATGAVRLLSSPNFEAQSAYRFTITATDVKGLSGSREVTLNVTDVNESTPIVIETTGHNDSAGFAQSLGSLTVADNPNLPDDSLASVTIRGSVSTSSDTDFFRIDLQAGELLILDVDNSGGNLDAFVRVFNGFVTNELASNDDAGSLDPGSAPHPEYGHNTDSLVRFRAPTSGTYYFSIESFQDPDKPTSGTYELNVSVGPPATPDQIISEDIDALVSGSTWQGSNVTYGFTSSSSQYGSGEGTAEIQAGMQSLTSAAQSAVRTILARTAGLINLSFSEVAGSPGTAQMRYALSGDPAAAHAYYPGAGDGGDSWYNRDGTYSNPVMGNYAWMTFVHETGHALGLKHGHESPALSYLRDSMEYSVMTYRGYVGASLEDGGGYANETWGFAQTFMMYDIAALQRMYGADFGFNGGNNVYSWNPSTGAFLIDGAVQWTPGANRIFMTLWDGGGQDRYDFSNYSTGVNINLWPGEWTTTSQVQLANLGDGNTARGNIANALLYNGDTRSLIEDAVGGSSSDFLKGNQAQNDLTGGPGADTFSFVSTDQSPVGALADILTDFVSGTDKIDLVALDANSQIFGNQNFTFIGSNAFSGAAGQLRTQTVGGATHVFADVDGDAVADLQIIVNAPSLTLNDFYV